MSCSSLSLRAVSGGRSWLLAALGSLVAAACSQAASVSQTTRISGDHAGYASVDLPRPVEAFPRDPAREPSFELQGNGGVLGAELREIRSDYKQPNSLLVLRVGRPRDPAVLVSAGGEGTLPPGRYQLYLITDAAGSVTMRFPTLTGETALTPAAGAPFTGGPLAIRPGATAGTSVFGRTAGIGPSGGLGLLRAIADSATTGDRLELCWYPGGDSSGGSSAYGATCPGGDSIRTEADASRGAFMILDSSSAGQEGFGGNFTRLLGPPVKLDAYAMWMSYVLPAGATPPPRSGGQVELLQGTAVLRSRRVVVKRGRAHVRLRCPGATRCRGTVRLGGARRAARFALRGRRTGTILLPMKRRVVRLVARGRRVRARLRLRSRGQGGIREERTTVRLVRAKGKRRSR